MAYRGDIQKFISYYQLQLACIPKGQETLYTQIHNFIVKLPPLLREKLQEKWHTFKTLPDAFDTAITLVNNRPDLAKVGTKDLADTSGNQKGKNQGNKRKFSEGPVIVPQQPAPGNAAKKGQKFEKPNKGLTAAQKAARDALNEKQKAEGLCFKCGAPGHLSRECTKGGAKPSGDVGTSSVKVSIALTNPSLADCRPVGVVLPGVEDVLTQKVPKSKLDDPDKLMFINVNSNSKACAAMVDTGATACFISSAAVERL